MARVFNGSSEYVRFGSAPVTAVPLSISARIRPGASGGGHTIFAVLNSASDNEWWRIAYNGTTDTALADSATSGGYSSAVSTATIASGVWGVVTGVFSSVTSRVVYVDNSKLTDPVTTSLTVSGANRLTVGVLDRPSITEYFEGDIAEVAVWNVAITDADQASLTAGASPLNVRPGALVFYAPFIGRLSTEKDFRGGLSASTTAGTAAAHPRIYGY